LPAPFSFSQRSRLIDPTPDAQADGQETGLHALQETFTVGSGLAQLSGKASFAPDFCPSSTSAGIAAKNRLLKFEECSKISYMKPPKGGRKLQGRKAAMAMSTGARRSAILAFLVAIGAVGASSSTHATALTVSGVYLQYWNTSPSVLFGEGGEGILYGAGSVMPNNSTGVATTTNLSTGNTITEPIGFLPSALSPDFLGNLWGSRRITGSERPVLPVLSGRDQAPCDASSTKSPSDARTAPHLR
jgi:hypothetical protein